MLKNNVGSVTGLPMVVVVINIFTCGLGTGVTFIAAATPTRRSTATPSPPDPRRGLVAACPGSGPSRPAAQGDERGRQQGVAHEVAVDRGRGRRPSAMAHTIRLWPRPMSPHTNTSSTLVAQRLVAGHVAPVGQLDAQVGQQALGLGSGEAHGQQHQLARQLEVGALDPLEGGPAVDDPALDLVAPQPGDLAVASPTNSVVVTE